MQPTNTWPWKGGFWRAKKKGGSRLSLDFFAAISQRNNNKKAHIMLYFLFAKVRRNDRATSQKDSGDS